MTRGSKIDVKMEQNIITSYAITNSYSKTAKELNISPNTVKKVILNQKENNAEEYAKVCKEKKELFQDKANEIIDKQLELLKRRVDTALNNQDELEEIINEIWNADKEEIKEQQKKSLVTKVSKLQLNSLSEITTSLGTLYDKMRLSKGESTENNSHTITVSMDDKVKELSK